MLDAEVGMSSLLVAHNYETSKIVRAVGGSIPCGSRTRGVGVVGCVGFLSACSLIWSDPVRSPFRNLRVHSSPRQVEVPPRARVSWEWGRWEWRLWFDCQVNASGCARVSCKSGLGRNCFQSEGLLPDRSSECPRRLVLGWRTLLPLGRLKYNSSALAVRLMVLR